MSRGHVLQPLLIACALAAGACENDFNPNRVPGELYANPVQLLDWSSRSVGAPHVAVLELTAQRAPVVLTGVTVRSTTRQGTFYTLQDYVQNFGSADVLGDDLFDTDGGDSLDSLSGLTVSDDDGVYDLQLVFTSDTPGYFQGVVEIAHDGRGEGLVAVDLRARAASPCVQITPRVVDFGNVPGGATGCEEIEVTACGALPVVISELSFQSSDFRVTGDDGLTVDPDTTESFEVCYAPSDSRPATSIATFYSGESPLDPDVTLRANDCLNGLPIEYDEDGDGFTTCGGDCDDDDASVNPGGVEGSVPNGKDDDCDGLTDNRSRGYDDDQDGYCDDPNSCLQPGVLPGDCNDGDPDVNPGMDEELGNGIDDDCSGTVDNGTADLDGDGYTVEAGDCDDDPNGDGAVRFPGNPEIADGIDNDCDVRKDEGTTAYDDDGDGYCEIGPCTDGSTPGDCDDRVDPVNPTGPHPGSVTYPGAPELADGRDNNCNDDVDDGTDRFDDDGDGYAEIGGDCDDDDPDIAPNVLEIPGNEIDDDCNPATPVGEDE